MITFTEHAKGNYLFSNVCKNIFMKLPKLNFLSITQNFGLCVEAGFCQIRSHLKVILNALYVMNYRIIRQYP